MGRGSDWVRLVGHHLVAGIDNGFRTSCKIEAS